MQILAGQVFSPYLFATLRDYLGQAGGLRCRGPFCGPWVLAPSGCRWGFWVTGGPKRDGLDGGAEREEPTRRARPVGHTRILPLAHPTRNDRKAVFPVFVSCFRFFRRGGMFHDGSVSAAVTHLVSCGGGYAGLPDACMCASLTAAVSWLVLPGLVWHPDICTLTRGPAHTHLQTQVDRGWSERGNLTLCEILEKWTCRPSDTTGTPHHQHHHVHVHSTLSVGGPGPWLDRRGGNFPLVRQDAMQDGRTDGRTGKNCGGWAGEETGGAEVEGGGGAKIRRVIVGSNTASRMKMMTERHTSSKTHG